MLSRLLGHSLSRSLRARQNRYYIHPVGKLPAAPTSITGTMPPKKRIPKQTAADSTTGTADDDDVVIVDNVKPAVPSPRKTRARAAMQVQPKSTSPDLEEATTAKGTKRPTKKNVAPAKTNGSAASSSNAAQDAHSDDEPVASESPKKKVKRTNGNKKEAKPGPEEDDDEPTTSKESKKNGRAPKGKKKEAKPTPEEEDEEPTVLSKKEVVLKTKAPVDEKCPLADTCHVFCEGEDVWDVALNQTAIGTNNNKFYIIQLLENDSQNLYHVYQRWGRVGFAGQSSMADCGSSLESAKKQFSKKFSDKTKNQWADRANFVKYPGVYDMVLRDYSANETDAPEPDVVDGAQSSKSTVAIPASTLAKPVQSLMEMIFNIKMMEQQVLEMNYDAKKAPLGKLTTDQVKSGYSALKTIATLLNLNDGSDGAAAPARYDEAALTEACNQFYTKIPHAFGMRRPTVINTPQQLKREMDLLETLGDIEVALRILKDVSSKAFTESPIDRHYRTLNADISHVEHGSPTFEMIRDYLRLTHGPTHSDYELDVIQAYKLKKQADFDEHLGNRMLLWHGSRMSNFAGILSQTLRIAPPEAPVTGYMFGKGIYFADVSSKSANYCYDTSSNGIGLMLLCDVALGTPNELLQADYNADQLPSGKHSTKGCGRHAPDSSTYRKLDDGVVVPIGKCVNLSAQDTRGSRSQFQTSLEYNEYIVYKQSQVRMRYLIQVRFDRGRSSRRY